VSCDGIFGDFGNYFAPFNGETLDMSGLGRVSFEVLFFLKLPIA
jgi:hypothetical protein